MYYSMYQILLRHDDIQYILSNILDRFSIKYATTPIINVIYQDNTIYNGERNIVIDNTISFNDILNCEEALASKTYEDLKDVLTFGPIKMLLTYS